MTEKSAGLIFFAAERQRLMHSLIVTASTLWLGGIILSEAEHDAC